MQAFKRCSPLRIPSYLCGADDRLTLPGLAAIFQEEAWLHARDLGFALTNPEDGLFWVLSRVVWHIRRWPEWDQQVVAQTWPSGMDRLLAVREFSLCTAEAWQADGPAATPLISATSGWVIMDAQTGRPVRPERHLSERLTISERALPVLLSKVSAPTPPDPDNEAHRDQAGRRLVVTDWQPVRRSAIDRNNHVNNTSYLQWMEDARPTPEMDPTAPPTEAITFVVHYLAETRLTHRYRVVRTVNSAWVQVSAAVAAGAPHPASATTAATLQEVELSSLALSEPQQPRQKE